MGTDVYLEWTGKTEEESTEQRNGCMTINAGYVGYLRASIGMANENGFLRMLFPAKYWQNRSSDEYDFKANYEMLNSMGLKYLVCAASGKQFETAEAQDKELKKQEQAALAIHGAITQLADRFGASEKFKLYIGAVRDFRCAVEWLNSVFGFFELGMEKQEKGLKPYPHISW
jgi:hypothetical protein